MDRCADDVTVHHNARQVMETYNAVLRKVRKERAYQRVVFASPEADPELPSTPPC